MKKIIPVIPILLLLSLLTACTSQQVYISIEPHNMESDARSGDSAGTTIHDYAGLRSAMLSLVRDSAESGTIRAEGYEGTIADDLAQAVYDITHTDPLGAYAVDYMTYDYSKIVSSYEIHMSITYRRTTEEIASVVYVEDNAAMEDKITDAMSSYSGLLRLRVGIFQETDFDALVQNIYRAHPEFALELPELTVSSYPDSGTQRILELQFDYENPPDVLEACREEMTAALENISYIYGGNPTQSVCTRRFYRRVTRDGSLVTQQEQLGTFVNSVYGALIEGNATSYGYAQAFSMLMNSKDIPCAVVEGTYLGQAHSWCRIVLEEGVMYADPSALLMDGGDIPMLMEYTELSFYGYSLSA